VVCCKVIGCQSGVFAASLCSKHYNRLRTTGTTDDGPRARRPFEERFWSSVHKGVGEQCWPWVGNSFLKGYGYISLGGGSAGKILSHRAAWTLTNGPIPKGKVVRHKCHNRLCCNPAHLILGTQADNVEDMWANVGGPRGNARLTPQQIAAIKSDPRSSRKLAPIYGVSDAHIRAIRSGRTWKTSQ
jgi:hypothetical protein